MLFTLHPKAPIPGALWIVWSEPRQQASSLIEGFDDYKKGLEMLLEVEYKERLYFHRADDPLGPELREAFTNGDGQALPTLLNTARMASDSGLTFWGDAANGAIEVEWHTGATGTGFNFELPVGEGVGGRAFARREAIHVDDYLNSKYRHPSARDEVDKQGARTVLSVPLSGRVPGSGAVLYGARRRVSGFTAAQRILLLRLARSVEPLIGERPVSRYFFSSDEAYLSKKRSELRRILTRSSKVQDLESWVEKFARGPAIVTNAEGRPYAPSRTDRFEELRCSPASIGVPRTVALAPHGERERGHLHVWSTASLPPAGWPDFLDDVAAACNVVLDRGEQTNDRLSSLRTRWLEEVMRSPTSETCREGRRLGLPVDGGGVWALAWTGGEEAAGNANRAWTKLVAQEIALDKLGSPLILTNGAVGVFLLGKPARDEPSAVRDALLEALEPAALWLVHGAVYDSFEGLQGSLLQAVTIAKGLRQDNDGQYVSDVGCVGLRSLLAKPELSEHLESFTDGLLAPLLAYDSETGSRLTETLALVLTVGSHEEVARRLNVHPKTIGYRTRRAEEILEKDLGSPTDKIALGMAAFVWANSQRSR